jgi:hypothetical protein
MGRHKTRVTRVADEFYLLGHERADELGIDFVDVTGMLAEQMRKKKPVSFALF